MSKMHETTVVKETECKGWERQRESKRERERGGRERWKQREGGNKTETERERGGPTREIGIDR